MAPSWDPERVLDVYPQANGFHCVGTTLQGLRCRQSFISRDCRRRATAMLDDLPELTQCRNEHVALLANLYYIAWYTLCPRWHQSKKPQADIISQRWLRTILDLERRNRETPSTSGSNTSRSTSLSSSSDTYRSTSSSDSSDSGPSRGNSRDRSSHSTPTLAFSTGSHSSRSNTLRGSSPSSGSQDSGPSFGPLYPASRESSVRPLSVTSSPHSQDSGLSTSSSSHTMRESAPASNAQNHPAISALAQTRQHWANRSVQPRTATAVASPNQDTSGTLIVQPITPAERNISGRSDAPSPSSPSVSPSMISLESPPNTASRTYRPEVFRTSAPTRFDEYQLPTAIRTLDVIQGATSLASAHSRVSTSTSSSHTSTTRRSNHVIHLNLNLNVTVAGRRVTSNSRIETPTLSTRHSRITDSPSISVNHSDRGSSSGSSSVVSAPESITELLAALEEVVARFNSRTAVSSPSAPRRQSRESVYTSESRTLSPEPPRTPTQGINTPPSLDSPTELEYENAVIVYTPESSGSSTPVRVSTPLSSGLESPVFVSPQPSPSARAITRSTGDISAWLLSTQGY